MEISIGRAALHAALVLSGFAALVYQTSWTRMLHRVFGVGDLAVATVLAAFFLGLGLGSWAAGRFARRIARPALVYAVLELIVAAYAALSPFLVPLASSAYGALGPEQSLLLLSAWRLLIALLVLLPPTLLMGATLPVVALIVAGHRPWARGVTALYFSNTMGAVLGAGTGGLVLIPQIGGRLSTWVAAVASLAAAAVVYALHRNARSRPAAPAPQPGRAPAEGRAPAAGRGEGSRSAKARARSLRRPNVAPAAGPVDETAAPAAEPADESAERAARAAETAEENADIAAPAAEPADESAERAVRAAEPADIAAPAAEPAEETDEPAEETAGPAEETAGLAEETAGPAGETAGSAEETAGPAEETAGPAEETVEPAEETAEPGAPTTEKTSEETDPPPRPARAPALTLAATLAAGAGAASLAGEVLWTRALRIVVHATTQAFAGMLVCYLLGIAFGALVARRVAASRLGPAWGFGVTQILAGLLVVGAMVALPHVARLVPLMNGAPQFAATEPWTILGVSGLLLLPLALVLGTGLPLAWSLAERVDPNAARGSGKLLAANTLGGLIGSLLAGFVLVPAMGLDASLLLVVFVHLLLAGLAMRTAIGVRRPGARALALTGPLALGVLLLTLQPSIELPFLLRASSEPMRAVVQGPGPSWSEPLVFLREGRSSTVTVVRQPGHLALANDGRPESGFGARDPGFGSELALLGSMPALFGERTDRAMAIGLGGGHTASVLLGGGFSRVDVVELEEAVVEAARLMHEARETPFPLDDPRAHLIVDDARNRLGLVEPGTYDAVVSQPSHPWLAGSSALYTREFFGEVSRALTDRGVFSLWVNLFRIQPRQIRAVLGTLREVFPHVQGFVSEFSSLVLCASKVPPRWDARLDERIERLDRPFLGSFGLGDRAGLARVLELDTQAVDVLSDGAPRIVDDRPLLEFELAGLSQEARVEVRTLDRLLRGVPWWSEGFAARWDGGARAEALAVRIAAVVDRPHALRRVELSLPHAGLSAAERAYVEGALAEARGRVRVALAAWDRAGTPRAAFRADQLRLQQGLLEALGRRSAQRQTLPEQAAPLLRGALKARDAVAMREALRVASALDRPEERNLRAYVQAELRQPCSSWREHQEAVEALARDVGEVAFAAQACAFATEDHEAAERLATYSVRARRAGAEGARALGQRCLAGGNRGCAEMAFRRALSLYPSNSAAAAGLARTLHATGRRAEARGVLAEAARVTRGIPPSQARLATTAEELGLDIGLRETPAGPERSPTSLAPASD